MINLGIIGYGNWGPKLVRNFMAVDLCTVKKVADQRKERLSLISSHYPAIESVQLNDDILNDPGIDAVVISTPIYTHYEIARKALGQGKHVLLEKPMTSNTDQALKLIELAGEKQKVLMVDHTLLYAGAVQKIKELIDGGETGKLNYFDSTRMNLGLFQPDINVLWDLAAHDISVLNFLINEKPYSVHSTGKCHTGNGVENIGYMTINYQSGLIAHFNCSWISPVKRRVILIGGDKKMIFFNDLEPAEKIRVYDCGYKYALNDKKYDIKVDYRTGDVYIPKISHKEALSTMAADFVNAIMKGTTPVSNHISGLEVMRILEASDNSMKNCGREVVLNHL